MNGRNFPHRFQLNDNAAGDNEIRIKLADLPPLVRHHNSLLLFVWQISLAQFNTERILIHRFQQARTEIAMNFHRCADNTVSQFIPLEHVQVPFAISSVFLGVLGVLGG